MTITSDPAAVAPSTRVNGNLSGSPATRGFTYEAFCTPLQYLRVGAQYTAYNRYNGASANYDGFGRNAQDNNSLFLYVWGAYWRRRRLGVAAGAGSGARRFLESASRPAPRMRSS